MEFTVKVYSHFCDVMGVDEIALDTKSDIEGADVKTRHHVLQIIAYLMLDLESQLRVAIAGKSVRYNHFKKDFKDAPGWYLEIVNEFSNWRDCQRKQTKQLQ